MLFTDNESISTTLFELPSELEKGEVGEIRNRIWLRHKYITSSAEEAYFKAEGKKRDRSENE